jgi:hypothetical protein
MIKVTNFIWYMRMTFVRKNAEYRCERSDPDGRRQDKSVDQDILDFGFSILDFIKQRCARVSSVSLNTSFPHALGGNPSEIGTRIQQNMGYARILYTNGAH